MKCAFLSFTLFLFSLTAQAAHPYFFVTPTNETNFKLAGRGFYEKKSGNSLSLVCLSQLENDNQCGKLRFVFLSSEGEAFYFGPIYKINSLLPQTRDSLDERETATVVHFSDPAAFHKHLKTLHKNALLSKRQWLVSAYLFASAATLGIGGAALIPGFAISQTAMFILGGMVWPMTATMVGATPSLIDPFTVTKGLIQGGTNEAKIKDQKNWNWATDPAHVTRYYFNHFIMAIDMNAYEELRNLRDLNRL